MPRGEEGDPFQAQVTGSLLDKFLRRFLISAGQMMFENITALYQSYQKYLLSQPYDFCHSTMQLENYTVKRLENIDSALMVSSQKDLEQ